MRFFRFAVTAGVPIALLLARHPPTPVSAPVPAAPATAWLDSVAARLGQHRVVLLGENGHGVEEFSVLKTALTQRLLREHGFDLVIMESGLEECEAARHAAGAAREALRTCLRYPFEHAVLEPLFREFLASDGDGEGAQLAGMDFQPQGFDAAGRPSRMRARLHGVEPALVHELVRVDSLLFLPPALGGLTPAAVDTLVRMSADTVLRLYAHAAEAAAPGVDRLALRLAGGWVERLAMRARVGNVPAVYEHRDAWMAHAVLGLLAAHGPEARAVVWLHNDHARYGRFPVGARDSIRSVGGFLQPHLGTEMFSVGLFLGRGWIADNSRRPREVVPYPAGSIEAELAEAAEPVPLVGRLAWSWFGGAGGRGTGGPAWAREERPYLRMGLDTLTITLAREFDAVLFVDSVSVPRYVE